MYRACFRQGFTNRNSCFSSSLTLNPLFESHSPSDSHSCERTRENTTKQTLIVQFIVFLSQLALAGSSQRIADAKPGSNSAADSQHRGLFYPHFSLCSRHRRFLSVCYVVLAMRHQFMAPRCDKGTALLHRVGRSKAAVVPSHRCNQQRGRNPPVRP